MSKTLRTRRNVLKKAFYVAPVILIMAANPSFASAGSTDYKDKEKKNWNEHKEKTNNGLHKGWFKDHDNNGLHKGWYKDHDFNNSNNNNGNPVRAVPEPVRCYFSPQGLVR
jgi:hypothetical protein